MTSSWPSNIFPSEFKLDQVLVLDPANGQVGTFFPIQIIENQYLEISAQQRPGAQDLSLDLWLSQIPWGKSPSFQFPKQDRNFAITKTPLRLRIGFFMLPLPQVDKYQYINLLPGNYFVNILNLENRINRVRVISKIGI
jgi:hypothetical protein